MYACNGNACNGMDNFFGVLVYPDDPHNTPKRYKIEYGENNS
jgi:hypothetical protein